jgi:hypothetical protein
VALGGVSIEEENSTAHEMASSSAPLAKIAASLCRQHQRRRQSGWRVIDEISAALSAGCSGRRVAALMPL